jgi:DNA-directed RNA polymerase specialized sigma24 family protein
VREAFFNLPEEQRSALHLVAIEGLSYSQAAEASGVPLGTLMSRIGRARAALREMEDAVPAKAKNHLRIVGGPS